MPVAVTSCRGCDRGHAIALVHSPSSMRQHRGKIRRDTCPTYSHHRSHILAAPNIVHLVDSAFRCDRMTHHSAKMRTFECSSSTSIVTFWSSSTISSRFSGLICDRSNAIPRSRIASCTC